MAVLYFRISSDWEQVVKLRNEITKLETQLKSFGKSTPEAEIRKMETQLASTKQQMMGLVTEAAKAGATMENDLKRKIDSVTKSSDELSSEIIKQRTIIRETQEDVRRLSEQYSKMGKYSPQSTSTLNQLNKAKAALNEQRYALGELQDQQAKNRLELRQLTREYQNFSQGTDKATVTVDALMSSLKRTAAEIGGLAAIRKFGMDVIDATGKMQQLQVSLSTILQSKSKADALLEEISEFAKKTPFNLDDVANGAKQLLAYGSSAENVVDELSMLGDVASGLQIPLGSLIYLYGTLRVQGRAYWRDIQQFQGRGVNVVEEMAKNLGVTQDQIKKLVEEGKIGFKEVEQAFQSMTSEGGKFNNMLENSAGTWPQRIANIEDTLFQKLNDFGNKYREVFEFGIGTTEELVEHLDDVISVIGSLIAAYGTYRAALIAAAVAQKAVGFVESIRLIMAYRKQLGLATAAQQAFNLASKSNVYVALLSVLVGLGTAIYMFTKRTKEATAAHEALSNVNKKVDEEFSTQAATIDRLNGVLKSETASLEQKKKALGELQSIIPNYNAKLDEEGQLINNNTEAIKEYLVQLEKQIRLKAAQEELEELYRKKRQQEKQQQAATVKYSEAQSLYNSSSTMTASALQRRGVNTGVTVFAQNNAVNNQLKDNANKAKKELESINSALDETLSGISAIEKEIEQTSLSSTKDVQQSNISKEIENVTKRIKTLKKEIVDLRSGKLQAEAGKTVESAIKTKEKELRVANETLETLTGNKTQTTKSENQILTQQSRIDELEQRQAQDRIRQQVDLENQVAQARIDAMADGAEKASAQRELDNKKELEAIERQKEEYKQKVIQSQKEIFDAQEELKTKQNPNYKKRSFDSSSVSVDTSMFDIIYDFTQKKQVNDRIREQEQAMNRYLQEYGTFQQKRLAITEEYNQKIQKALSENNMGEALAFTQERNRLLSSLDKEKAFEGIERAFGNISNLSGKAIDSLIDNLKKYKKESIDTFDVSDIDRYEKALSRLEDAKLENKFSVFSNFIPDFYREQIKLEEEFNQAQETSIELGQKQAELEKEILEYIEKQTGKKFKKEDLYSTEGINGIAGLLSGKGGDSLSKFTEMKSSLDSVSAASDNAGQKMSALFNMKGGSGGGASTVAVIDTIVHGINDLVQGLNDMANEIKDTMEALGRNTDIDSGIGKFAEGMSMFAEASQGATDAWDSLKSGNIGGVFAGVTKSFTAWIKGFAGIHDKKNEKRIQQLQEQVDTLTDSYDKLGRAVEDAYSKDASGLIEDQNKLLEQQKLLIEQQIREEQDKKNTDDERIKEWRQQIEEINQTIEDNKEAAVDAIFGEDLQSAIENFADAYAEAWANGEDKAESAKDTVKKMMQQMVTESIKAAMQSSGAMEEIRNKLQQFYADNVLTGWEQDYIYNMAEELQKELDSQFGWADSLFGNDEAKKQQSASSRGFGTEMTHEDAGELSGRFTALNESSLRQESIQQGISNIADDMRNIIAQSYLELQQISENTGEIIKPIKQMQLDIAEVKRNTSRI